MLRTTAFDRKIGQMDLLSAGQSTVTDIEIVDDDIGLQYVREEDYNGAV